MPRHPALDALHRYLDSRRGVGRVAVGMHWFGCDLQLTEYGGRPAMGLAVRDQCCVTRGVEEYAVDAR